MTNVSYNGTYISLLFMMLRAPSATSIASKSSRSPSSEFIRHLLPLSTLLEASLRGRLRIGQTEEASHKRSLTCDLFGQQLPIQLPTLLPTKWKSHTWAIDNLEQETNRINCARRRWRVTLSPIFHHTMPMPYDALILKGRSAHDLHSSQAVIDAY